MAGTSPAGIEVSMRKRPSLPVSTRPKPNGFDFPRAAPLAPFGGACHVSTSASPTALPAPSTMRPASTTRSPRVEKATLPPSRQRNPRWKKGPMVCDGERCVMSQAHGSRTRARKNDVEAIAQRDHLDPGLQMLRADEALARLCIRDALVHRIDGKERIAREIHLRHEPLHGRIAKEREVDVLRTPREWVVAPRIRARLDGDEAIVAFPIRE